MRVRVKAASACVESEVTPEAIYRQRRALAKALGLGALGALLPGNARADVRYPGQAPAATPDWFAQQLARVAWSPGPDPDDQVTPFEDATHYNNFYEFGPDKGDPARHAPRMTIEPWVVTVDGEVARPGQYSVEELCGPSLIEERIYRLRCVEAWSMVIPWLGIPFADLARRVEPTSRARFVRFETLLRPEEMPGTRSAFTLIDWPYVEGLRLDEAMHPLTLLAVGMYGRVLPAQNGAPLRLVVPWKYGFKSIKSIVRISFVSDQPATTWQRMAPHEYGFYANVNPAVSHPRWSQARERRLPGSLFRPNLRETTLFNGYAEEVASLYAGMDLARDY